MTNAMTYTRLFTALALLSGTALAGCIGGEASDSPSHASDEAGQTEILATDDAERLADEIVGRWQFVYTDDRRAEVERRLNARIDDPDELGAAKAEAQVEARASEIEFTADRRYVSRIGDEVLLSARFDARTHGEGGVALTPVGNDGPTIRVELVDPNTLVMHEPRKGPLTFTRK